MKFLSGFTDTAYALLRIVSGFLFAFHGAQKVFGLFGGNQPPLWTQIWVGGVIELVCGLAIMLGAQTRLAAFLSSGTMAVAYFQYHWKFQSGLAILPGVNKGELAALYSFVFLYIACKGGVKWRLDNN